MANSILKAIKMPVDAQVRRNQTMQKRLSRYTVKYWANAFFKTLKNKSNEKKDTSTIKIKNGLTILFISHNLDLSENFDNVLEISEKSIKNIK